MEREEEEALLLLKEDPRGRSWEGGERDEEEADAVTAAISISHG